VFGATVAVGARRPWAAAEDVPLAALVLPACVRRAYPVLIGWFRPVGICGYGRAVDPHLLVNHVALGCLVVVGGRAEMTGAVPHPNVISFVALPLLARTMISLGSAYLLGITRLQLATLGRAVFLAWVFFALSVTRPG
jgi:hypothetical protein